MEKNNQMVQNSFTTLSAWIGETFMEDAQSITFEFKNTKPVELADLTDSLAAFGREYTDFTSCDDSHVTTDGVRLYIKKIQDGSIIAELVAAAPAAVLPFIDNANSVFAFAGHLKTLFGKLQDGTIAEGKYSRQSLENAAQIVEPVAKDSGSQINISGTNAKVYVSLNSTESNAIQNQSARVLRDMRLPVTGRHHKVVLKWFQARNDPKSKAGDRAIIESISEKSVKTVFASADEKQSLVLGVDNFFIGAYLVDVDVETVSGVPALYKIVSVREHMEGFDDE